VRLTPRIRPLKSGEDTVMATTKNLLFELDGIWLATLRAERRHRIETMILGIAALASGACMAIGLAHMYTSLAGLR
jgi:hypothetical protein